MYMHLYSIANCDFEANVELALRFISQFDLAFECAAYPFLISATNILPPFENFII